MINISIFNIKMAHNQYEVVQVKFLQFFYFVCVFLIPFFIIKNSFLNTEHVWDRVSLPLYVIFLSVPFFGRFSKDYFLTALSAIMLASLLLTILLYEAGGLDAPGLFWLAAIPVTFAIALGRTGGIIGSVFLLLSIILFVATNFMGIQIGIIKFTEDSYRTERLINLFTFSLYIIFTTQYYIRNEEKASAELQVSRKEVETLLRTVMHDIATPVTVSTMGMQLLQKPKLGPEEQQRAMRRISLGLENITKILQQVRVLKSMQDGKLAFTKERIDVNQCLASILELLEPIAAVKNVKFIFSPHSRQPTIFADHIIFKNLIITNFLTNAIKFSHHNSCIYVFVELTDDQKNDQWVKVRIRDEGIGIPPEIFQNIWKIDKVTSRTGTNGETGTGYGMPLAKEFSEKMGGKIDLRTSEVGSTEGFSGTEVTVGFRQKC